MARARATTLGLLSLLILFVLGCGSDAAGGVRILGTFQLCLHRLVDSCTDTAGLCRSSRGQLLTVTLTELPGGRLLWSSGGTPAMEGRRVGRRFELRSLAPVATALCSCSGQVTEFLRGELYEARTVMPTCNFAEEQGGCGSEAAPAFFEDGLPGENWLAGGGAIASDAVIGSLRAVVWDTVESATSASCGCLPCTARFEMEGVQ